MNTLEIEFRIFFDRLYNKFIKNMHFIIKRKEYKKRISGSFHKIDNLFENSMLKNANFSMKKENVL